MSDPTHPGGSNPPPEYFPPEYTPTGEVRGSRTGPVPPSPGYVPPGETRAEAGAAAGAAPGYVPPGDTRSAPGSAPPGYVPPGHTPPGYNPPPRNSGVGGTLAKGAVSLMAILGGLFLLLILALVVAVSMFMKATSGPVKAADNFFATAAHDGAFASYNAAAPGMRAVLPLDTWTAISSTWALANYNNASWTVREVHPYSAHLEGELHMLTGPDIDAKVNLEKEPNGVWRVLGLNLDKQGGAATDTASATSATPAPAPVSAPPPAAPTTNATPDEIAAGVSPVGSVPPLSHPGMVSQPQASGGRAGPPGVYLASGQIGPTCMSQLTSTGFRTSDVNCPQTYLPTRPGATEQCYARREGDFSGARRSVTVTFQDYDPVTRQGSITCALN